MFRKQAGLIIVGGAIIFVVVIVILALTGTAVGNVFSQIYHACGEGCGSFNSGASNSYSPPQTGIVTTSMPAPPSQSDSGSVPVSYTQQQRVVLKNATLTLTVENTAQTVTQITQLAEGIGGWVVSSATIGGLHNGYELAQATISVRVPADKFVTVLAQIKAGAVSVDSETITGDDVTQKYVDLNSQLTNLQNTETQLQKIMSTATKVTDVLSVQSKLTDVQGQIEQIKGQLQYYNQAAAYSLIALTLIQKSPPAAPTPASFGIGDWHPGDTVHEAASTLLALVQTLITLTIWLVIVGVPFGILGLIGYGIWRRTQPKRKATG
ncbi:MAG: DUF4349 domain-containing protein [Aggregatilineales bacterium]